MHRMHCKAVFVVLALSLTLGCWKGYLALFETGKSEPQQIFPRQVTILPAIDQQALADGIIIRSEKRLQQLLEDYLS